MIRPQNQTPDPDDSLPEGLLRDLSSLQRTPRVPPMVDARVLQNVSSTLMSQRRRARRLFWGGAGAAAAAAVVIVAMLLPHDSNRPPAVSLAGDIDGSGRVDILDAFSLSRKLRDARGKPVPPTPIEDVNGDGVIDEKDVDLIARLAVKTDARK